MKKYKKNYLISLLNEGLRLDNRGFFDYRKIKLKKGVIKNAEGSAYVEIGNTKVLCGVKIEISEPFPEFPEEGIIITNLDLTPLCSEDVPPELIPIEAELGRIIDRGIRESKLIDTKQLVIEKGKHVWSILIDIAVLNDDGNVIDAGGLAAYIALKDAFFPELYKDENDKYVLNYKKKTNKFLPVNKIVLPFTFAKIGNHLVIDPSKEEELLADVIFVVGRDNNYIYSLQKSKEGVLKKEDIQTALLVSKEKYNFLVDLIKKQLYL